ncbi:MAG: serine hydrolase [Eggerthellaceae bacterium]
MKRIALGAFTLAVMVSLCGCGAIGADSDPVQDGSDGCGYDSVEIEAEDKKVPEDDLESENPIDPSDSSAMEDAARKMEEIAAASGMDVGAVAIDLETGEYAGVRGNESVPSASMIKMIIAAAFLETVAQGDCSLDEPYTLQESDIVGGTGSLQGLGAGATVSYRDLVTKMISESDNIATNVLIDACGGMEVVNSEAKKLGLSGTQLNRMMMDAAAMEQGVENYVSADDLAILFRMVYNGTFVDGESSELVLQALEQQTDNAGIPQGLPADTVFAHKTGTLATVRHDGGIVEGDHPYVLVVLCSESGFNEAGALFCMEQIAEATYSEIAG